MSTLRQIEANRRNAQKSTGPASVTGKTVSSMNNLKTGIHAKSLVLPYENLADLQQLVEECYLHYHPTNPEQRFYVDDLVRCEWTLRRLDNAETQTWQHQNHDIYRDPEKYPLGKASSCNPNSFSKLQYRLDATRRARDRAILAIERLQAKAAAAPGPPVEPAPVVEPEDPLFLPPSPQTTSLQIGFVPPIPTAANPANPGQSRISGAVCRKFGDCTRVCLAGYAPPFVVSPKRLGTPPITAATPAPLHKVESRIA
jgi:hypothetical protein